MNNTQIKSIRYTVLALFAFFFMNSILHARSLIGYGWVDSTQYYYHYLPDDDNWNWSVNCRGSWNSLVDEFIFGINTSGGEPIRDQLPTPNNEKFEMGVLTSAQMTARGYSTWEAMDANGVCYSWYESNNRIKEADIMVNPDIQNNESQFKKTLTHEYGHAVGLEHNESYVNIMYPGTFRQPPNYSATAYYTRMYDNYVMRNNLMWVNENVSSGTWTVNSFRDPAVWSQSHTNPGTTGNFIMTSVSPSSITPDQVLTISNIYMENRGNTSASNVYLRFYLSTNTIISSMDHEIGHLYWSTLPVTGYWTGEKSFTIPSIPGGTYYIGAIVSCEETEFTSLNNHMLLRQSSANNFNPVTITFIPECSVNTPTQPSGLSNGLTNMGYIISTGGSSCANSAHDVQYRFDWGDGNWSNWTNLTYAGKAWNTAGTYTIRAFARCATNTSVVSSVSPGHTVTIVDGCFVNPPNRPEGETNGVINTLYPYTTGGSSCLNSAHNVQYRFWWRRTDDVWNSEPWGKNSIQLSFGKTGTYEIVAQARCAIDTSVIASNSEILSVSINVPCSVNAPHQPAGETNGVTGSLYSYNTGGASCSNSAHNVQYRFDWGDGSYSSWSSSMSVSKSWDSPGSYDVLAQARCASSTSVISSWSSELTVSIDERVYNAQSVSHNIPGSLLPDREYQIWITMQNTGNCPWENDGPVKLAAVDDSDPFALSHYLRNSLTRDVLPGEDYTFSLIFHTPLEQQSYITEWQMLREREFWFGEVFSKEVEVLSCTDVERALWQLFE